MNIYIAHYHFKEISTACVKIQQHGGFNSWGGQEVAVFLRILILLLKFPQIRDI